MKFKKENDTPYLALSLKIWKEQILVCDLLNFQKKNLKSNISRKLGLLIIIKSPPWNLTHWGLFKNIKSAFKFFFYYKYFT
jgi:hypothetical protein